MKKSFIFTFVMVVLGAIIGAGFASGKEIVSFFGKLGYWSMPFMLLVGGLFFFFFYVFAKLGKMIKPKSISDMTNTMFGKFGIIVDFGFILSAFITLSSMIAGCDSVGSLVFKEGYNFCYISIFTVMIVAIILMFGLRYIYKITNIIIPSIIVLIVVILLTFASKTPTESISTSNINFNFASALIYSILYVCMNTFTNIFIISKSSEYMNKKQIGIASVISSSLVVLLVALILLSILRGGDAIFLSDMPMINIAYSVGGVAGITYSVILWLAIFTTICIATYSIVEWLNKFIKNKFLCIVIVLTLGFVFSRFGFSTIVDIFYPIEGIFGGIFILYSIIYYFKNKKQYELKERALLENLKFAESKSLFEFDTQNALTENINKNTQSNEQTENLVQIPNSKQESKNKKRKKQNFNPDEIYSLKIEKKKHQFLITKKKRNGETIKDVKQRVDF